jgi:threonyl-tRNA synthetase
MNCPFHILVYKSRQRSYRELPLRLFEFGTVYRYEKSGVVHGPDPGAGLTQDDAHIFCTREQMDDELVGPPTSCSTCCATSGSTTSTSSCRPSRGQGHRLRRGVGRGDRGAALDRAEEWASSW